MDRPDNGECGQETRPHGEAEEYRRFLEEPDGISEEIEVLEAGDEGVAELDGNLEDAEIVDTGHEGVIELDVNMEDKEIAVMDHEEVTELDGDLQVLLRKRRRALEREM